MIDRRDFLKLAGVCGVAVGGPALAHAFVEGFDTPEPDRQLAEGYEGPMFIQVQATGGWEPTMLCDPKGNLNGLYGDGDILTAGNIPYAPVGPEWDTFFTTNQNRLTVVNGVDIQTNSHDAGRRHMASGRLGEGYPMMAALAAGAAAPHLPMSLLTFGGYEMTSGVVAPTRDIDRNRLAGISYPERINPDDAGSATWHSRTTNGIVNLARNARTQSMLANTQLPKRAGSLDTLMTSRLGSDQLKRLEELLPQLDGNGEEQRVQLAVAAYRAGICSSANFSRGGFDTHGTHDTNHSNRMRELLTLINFIWQTVDDAGISDRVIMLITSDFGRTPNYNGNGGKDHWPVSSMMVVSELTQGNRVVGLSDEGHRPIPLDAGTMQAAANPDDGDRINPEHVHKSIRDLLGITDSDVGRMFPLSPSTDMEILIPA